jgi:hypothetical protein
MAFCSLITSTPQAIPPNTYTALRFDTESTDIPGWHPSQNLKDPASALIIPDVNVVALVAGLVFWAAAMQSMTAPTQYLARITRNPFDPDLIDSTATHDRAPTPGGQFDVFSWPMVVRDRQPLAIMVAHNGSAPLAVNLAEFKVWVP